MGLTMVCGLVEGSMENGKHVCGERKTHLHAFQGMLGAVNKRIKCAEGSVLCVIFFLKKTVYNVCAVQEEEH